MPVARAMAAVEGVEGSELVIVEEEEGYWERMGGMVALKDDKMLSISGAFCFIKNYLYFGRARHSWEPISLNSA